MCLTASFEDHENQSISLDKLQEDRGKKSHVFQQNGQSVLVLPIDTKQKYDHLIQTESGKYISSRPCPKHNYKLRQLTAGRRDDVVWQKVDIAEIGSYFNQIIGDEEVKQDREKVI